MPYIKSIDRLNYDGIIDRFPTIFTTGELNYIITSIIQKYLGGNPNYQAFNDVVGVLECAKLELYRRRVSDYEDKKIEENGDVY